MSRKLFTLLLLLAIVTGTVNAQRGKRTIKRIDREVQEAVFIPKGTWMAGGAVSYSEHDESNLNFLVIKDLEGNGYNFAISPYVGYFFRDNISAGVRFAYRRNYLDLGNVDANLGDITISFKDLYYLEHKYETSGFLRTYIPIGKSKIFGLFNEARVTYGTVRARIPQARGLIMMVLTRRYRTYRLVSPPDWLPLSPIGAPWRCRSV